MVPLISHPFFFFSINFCSCTQHLATFYVYTQKNNQAAVSIHTGFLTCIRFWKCFFLRHVGQLCILSIPDAIRYFLVISNPAETPVFSFIDHVIRRKQASLLPIWVSTPDVNVNTTSFTVKMERPIKLSKDWCCVPQCKSDGRMRGK